MSAGSRRHASAWLASTILLADKWSQYRERTGVPSGQPAWGGGCDLVTVLVIGFLTSIETRSLPLSVLTSSINLGHHLTNLPTKVFDLLFGSGDHIFAASARTY